ncbi:MAG: hypothetical protein IJX27_04615, partial [Clostridia bacterium]|nr:hypothetical protein [Clostridia bacterium]
PFCSVIPSFSKLSLIAKSPLRHLVVSILSHFGGYLLKKQKFFIFFPKKSRPERQYATGRLDLLHLSERFWKNRGQTLT